MTKFVIGNINPGKVSHGYHLRVLDLFQHPFSFDHHTELVGYIPKSPAGPYLDCERNLVVQQFMVNPDYAAADVLVFIDSDTVPDDSAYVHELASLCVPSRPVVGGMYLNSFAGEIRALAFNWEPSTETDDTHPLPKLRALDPAVLSSPQEVMVLGTGFMAIHRTLLDHMGRVFDHPTPWFAELALHSQQMGEDVTFCMRVQSQLLTREPDADREYGYPVTIYPHLTATHYKTTALKVATTAALTSQE